MKAKKIMAAIIAVTTMAVGIGSVNASAVIVDNNTPSYSQSWDVRHIGGGAPSSEDKTSRFYVYYSSGGHKGNCQTFSSEDTECGVTATVVSIHTASDPFIWNKTGIKTWGLSGSTDHVRYMVSAYGDMTYSTGYIVRL